MTTNELARKYVALCKESRHVECLDTLFAEDAVSVEAATPPVGERTTKGLAALHAKGKWWGENHTLHKSELFGPYPHDDRFAVRFLYDITHKPSGKRLTRDEVGLFTVAEGKIVREEFFYTTG
jgi:ketosteroid isomerase-like protein